MRVCANNSIQLYITHLNVSSGSVMYVYEVSWRCKHHVKDDLLFLCVWYYLFLCRGNVDLDGKNLGGWTPLMYSAYIGHDNIANLLLESGVGVNACTSKGLTPLMLAASCGNKSIAYFLLQVQICLFN